jgi:transcriptional regulator with XRE-family HTH domain
MSPKEIVRIREALGFTQSELALLIGVHQITVSKWEREILTPTAHQVAIMEAFGKAADRDSQAGAAAVQLLTSKGVAAALHHLLGTAFEG